MSYLFSPQHLLAGTELGSVRRYDTRAARRPVADWTTISSQGAGIKAVQRGAAEQFVVVTFFSACTHYNDSEAFVSDTSNGLYAIDLRNGRVLYKYRGMLASSLFRTIDQLFIRCSWRGELHRTLSCLSRYHRLR